MQKALRRFDAGVHLKTAGTTWLEELIGLAMAGGEGLAMAREVYAGAYQRYEEMAGPYATVIDIHREKLPRPEAVNGWSPEQYAGALRHDPACPEFNLHFRQLLHVGYKVAAEMGERFLHALDRYEETIARQVTENILERHLKRLFL